MQHRLSKRQARFANAMRILVRVYGSRESSLGNLRDPILEIVYILLSFQTDVPRLKAIWKSLRAACPSRASLLRADETTILTAIRSGGLQQQKARNIHRFTVRLAELNIQDLRWLRHVPAREAMDFLVSLPGVGTKAAKCVLLYSLDHPSLPLDSNSLRILKRLAVVPESAHYRTQKVNEAVEQMVPSPLRKRVHIGLVLHGQEVCRPTVPRCGACVLETICPKIGVTSLETPAAAARGLPPGIRTTNVARRRA